MITTMRGCVAHHDLSPWPISSRSFGLDLENRVRSVASTVLNGFFLYLAQMITIIRRCVGCYVFFRIWKFQILANFWHSLALTLKKKNNSRWILSIFSTNDHYHERVCRIEWPLTLTYIFKVILPWPWKTCPLCSIYSSWWILPIFGTNDH